jgi:DNA-binding transcriptional regulator YiaG
MTPTEIRAARHALGMTHRQLAVAIGVQQQTAQRWEIDAGKRSHRKPSTQTVMLLRQMLAARAQLIVESE